jgi:hypothetical protein
MREYERNMRNRFCVRFAAVIVACIGLSSAVQAAEFGQINADRILFLGNSITLCLPNNWGLSASTPEKDYAHLLAGKIDAQTGGRLLMVSMDKKLVDGEQQPGTANILNVAHIFERNYRTYKAEKLRYQIDAKPDIVIMAFGENVPPATFDAAIFKKALQTLADDFKAGSNPHIFMSGVILGSNTIIDGIKRDVCAENPSHRAFVDMTVVSRDPKNIGDFGHPNDQGMQKIAETLFQAIQKRGTEKANAK